MHDGGRALLLPVFEVRWAVQARRSSYTEEFFRGAAGEPAIGSGQEVTLHWALKPEGLDQ